MRGTPSPHHFARPGVPSGCVVGAGAASSKFARVSLASSGNAGGPSLVTTVLPFILRGVALVGMDSSAVPIADRRALWARLATDLRPTALGLGVSEVTLDTLPEALDAILAGEAKGRWVVRVTST